MKKPAGNINWIQSTPSLWILILLVSFFSSCTVRKGIQANFEIPVTKQLNPSKTVSNQQLTCQYAEAGVKATLISQDSGFDSGFLPHIQEELVKPFTCFYKKKNPVTSGWPLTSKIESYILFRQMKSRINLHIPFIMDNNQG